MSGSYGITGIGGFNPYMGGLGSLGLGAGSAYGNYGDPTSMMGMGYGNMGYNSLGMMGAYNPMFMQQMNTAYQQIEQGQLEHASAMHRILQQNKVDDYKADDAAISQISMEDSGLESSIADLAKVIRKGDADAICEQYDKLKIALYQKYSNYFRANRDRLDPDRTVRGMIEERYAAIMSKKDNQPVSLKGDLETYRETAFQHGFTNNYFGKRDYHEKYTEEAINYIYGTRIDNKRGNDRMEAIGGVIGRGAEVGATGLIGGTTGAGLTVATAMLAPGCFKIDAKDEAGNIKREAEKIIRDTSGKIIKKEPGKIIKEFSFKRLGKSMKWVGLICAAGLAIADIGWQLARE